MVKLASKRAIIDRRVLVGEIDRLAAAEGDGAGLRRAVLGVLKRALGHGRAEIARRFEAGASGRTVAAAHCYLVDQILRLLYEFATLRADPASGPAKGGPTADKRIAVVAVGGYGRGELAPFSDVDLLFLVPGKPRPRPGKPTPWVEQIVETMLYVLWDLGLMVGHATRSTGECIGRARADLTIRTALLEARCVTGDVALYGDMRRRFAAEVVAGTGPQFVRAKLAERDARHRHMGDSRYVLEPNIKEGKGGLRDLHTLVWIARYLYGVDDVADLVERGVLSAGEHARFVKAEAFLWALRCHLHYTADRAEERLTFDVQTGIARRMRYADRAGSRAVERFMKHYFLVAKDVGDLTRVFCAAIEVAEGGGARGRPGAGGRAIEGFTVDSGRLGVASETAFADDPAAMIRLFHLADRRGLDVHPEALRLIRKSLKRIDARLRGDAEVNRLFVEVLTSRNDAETTLRRMNEAGVLGRLIPDFGRVVAQVQHDMYHVYTVDEHTVRAIGILARIERGALADELPLATGIIHDVLSRRVLYIAMFLHDIAKGRPGDHSEVGAGVALKLCPRLGLTAEETETVAWLVRDHLLLSNTAFKRDLNDPKTITDFVERVQSPERLRLLLVLTAADIRAVGPNVWNAWKGALLRQLYFLAAEVISGGHAAEAKQSRVTAMKEGLAAALADWPAAEIARHVERFYPPYWLSFDGAGHAAHARLMREAERAGAPLTLDQRVLGHHEITEVTIFTPDRHGLFSKLTGAMAIAGASIVNAKIFTTSDRVALDVFWIEDVAGGAFERPDKLARLATLVEQAVTGSLDIGAALAARRGLPSRTAAAFTVEPRVLIDNKASTHHTVIEVNGRDRPGLLYSVTDALAALALSVVTAHVSTFGERAVDAFYVKDASGLKIEHAGKLRKIRARLLAALADPGDAGRSAPVPQRRALRRA